MYRYTYVYIYVCAAFPFVVAGSDERSCPLGRLQPVNGLKKGSTTVAAALMVAFVSVPVEIDMFFRRSYRTDYSFVVLIFMSIITQCRLSQQP